MRRHTPSSNVGGNRGKNFGFLITLLIAFIVVLIISSVFCELKINLQKDVHFEDTVAYVEKASLSQRPFTITKGALQICYQDYEIAPYLTGMPIFEIPF